MGAQVWRPSAWLDDTHVGASSSENVDHKKSICAGVYAGNDLFTRPLPGRTISDVGDVLVCTKAVRFRNASHLTVCHVSLPVVCQLSRIGLLDDSPMRPRTVSRFALLPVTTGTEVRFCQGMTLHEWDTTALLRRVNGRNLDSPYVRNLECEQYDRLRKKSSLTGVGTI